MKPLHTKYRPEKLENVLGHESLKASLGDMLSSENTPHAYGFYGPAGCGKTTLGRIIANHLQCDALSRVEVDAGADRGVENVRELIEEAQFKPVHGSVKVYIIDEAHGLTAHAQDALLKTLEDCPAHDYFVLCSTDPQKIKPTIRSRCAEFTVSRLSSTLVKGLLYDVCDAEGLVDRPSDGVLDVVVECADGVPRDALVYLAMVKDFEDPQKAEELISSRAQSAEFLDLLNAVVRREGAAKVLACYKNLPEREPIKVRVGLANALKTKMLKVRGKEMESCAGLLQHFARRTSYEMAEAELVLDLYLAASN